MTHGLLEKRRSGTGLQGGARLFDAGEPRSLDELVSKLSQTLSVRGNAACPVCGATIVRSADPDSSDSATCGGCGSRLE